MDFSFTTIYLGKIQGNVLDKDKYLLKILLTSCRKAIICKWLQVDPPTKDQWLGIVNEIYSMERLTFILRLKFDKCNTFWGK